MMRERCYGSLTRDINFWQVYKALASEGCLFLYTVFCWGCRKDPFVTLKEYLVNEKGLTFQDYKKRFTKTMREKIDENACGDDFDISLLFASIKTACEDLAEENSKVWTDPDDTKLEYLCTDLKEMRDTLIHENKISGESERNERIDAIEDVISKGFSIAGKLYGRDREEIERCIDEMKKGLCEIRRAEVMPLNVEQYKKEVNEFQMYLERVVGEEIGEMKENYVDIESVDPASWFSRNVGMKLKAIFTRVNVVKEKTDPVNSEPVDYENMLETPTEDGRVPPVVVLEGEAGAGKTTLCRLLMAEWGESENIPPSFKSLSQYDIILFFECRNHHIKKFEDLLRVSFPKSLCYIRMAELTSFVLSHKVLIIADGLDEGNDNSERLLKEIICSTIPHSGGMLRLVLTTRPERFYKLTRLCQNACWLHTKIVGIAIHKRSEFVHRLHSEMINKNLSKQNTQDLIDFLKQSQIRIGEHYRLPLILTFLTYLWAYNPSSVNAVTTSTRLYIAFHEMVLNRLLDRLLLCKSESHEVLKKRCEDFLKLLYEVSSATLRSGHMRLSKECSDKLSEECRKLDLPSEEVCAAYLSSDRKWTSVGYETYLTLPHKSIVEFYAAQFIFYRMFLHSDDDEFDRELREICLKYDKTLNEIREILDVSQTQKEKKTLYDCIVDIFNIGKPDHYLSDYRTVFFHFGGIVAKKQPSSWENMASEYTKLLLEARVHGGQWLDVITETECSDEVTRLVAENLDLKLIIRDGHTRAALQVMKHLDERIPVRIVLDCEVLHVPHLEVMLSQIAERDCDVELFLNHQWRDSDLGLSDNLLGSLINNKCRLYQFAGNLNSLKSLPDTIKKLRCIIHDNEHAATLCKDLQSLHQRLDLEYLGVHVVVGVNPENLGKLPICKRISKECATIWMSKVSNRDVEWACNVARALLPDEW